MPLSSARILLQGLTPHIHEQEAIEFLKQAIPDQEPYRLWALFELCDPQGRRYEIDALVLGYHALYLVEIKSYPGVVDGDVVDWTITHQGRQTLRENPRSLTERKARILASMLDRRLERSDRPRVEALVFLSHPDIKIALKDNAAAGVLSRSTLARAFTHHEYPGSRNPPSVISTVQAKKISEALRALGVKQSQGALKLGEWLLESLVEEGTGYQDRTARNERMSEIRCRVREYLVPQSPTQERREQLTRTAEREARLLTLLSDHPHILKVRSYVPDGPTGGPCIVFESFDGAAPLDAFLRRNPSLPFIQRVKLLAQVGEALEYCHRKNVLHRGLYPGAVLVRQLAGADIEVRLYNFQLAAAEGSSGATHISDLSPDQSFLFRAPEVIEDFSRSSIASDVFSLGALAYFVFTGRNPGSDLRERQQLLSSGALSIAAVRDDLAIAGVAHDLLYFKEEGNRTQRGQGLDAVVRSATDTLAARRTESAMEWVNLLLQESAAPATTAGLDPLTANPGDRITDELEVLSLLGSGATSRVLRVRQGSAEYALKVALSTDLNPRLEAEAEILRRLRSDRIVELKETFELSGRRCLKLTFAGETLAQLLAQKGPISLDYAKRWGEDLLLALEELEKQGIQHRDIKPQNVGVLPSASKKTRRLLLFDFSLSTIDSTAVTSGTPSYRDPFLPSRGRWDEAADRYSAALTLYEMLTGSRPRWGSGQEAATSIQEEVSLDAELFYAEARGRLLAFFQRSFARSVEGRFESVELMREAWNACFLSASVPSEEKAPEVQTGLRDLGLESVVAALPLSVHAKNALDRSGILSVRELLSLPQNQLSSIRGVGRETAQEILAFTQKYLAERPMPEVAEPFYPSYRGPDTSVRYVKGLSTQAATALEDAALQRLGLVAAASKVRVKQLLDRFAGAEKAIHSALSSRAPEGAEPATIEAWCEYLFPASTAGKAKSKSGDAFRRYVRHVYKLDAESDSSLDISAIAEQLKTSRQTIYSALNKAREEWLAYPFFSSLASRVRATLELLGGVASLGRLAENLSLYIPHDSGAPEEQSRRNAAALCLAIAESFPAISGASIENAFFKKRLQNIVWLSTHESAIDLLKQLGEEADALAAREPIPSSDEVKEALSVIVKQSPLEALTQDKLTMLAAEASQHAARSARLELYPKQMSAARALRLSAGALTAESYAIDALQKIVLARYPEAEALPERPALDDLLKEQRLQWSPEKQCYLRYQEYAQSSSRTLAPIERQMTIISEQPKVLTPEIIEAQEFSEKLRLTKDRRGFRVIEARAPHDNNAAKELCRWFGVQPTSIERELLRHVSKLINELEIDPNVVFEADREGPQGEGWQNLLLLMQEAAKRLSDELCRSGDLLVLIHLGLLARYQLDRLLPALLEATQRDDGPAVFVVVPIRDSAGDGVIDSTNGPLSIPTHHNGQRVRVPDSWLQNVHRG